MSRVSEQLWRWMRPLRKVRHFTQRGRRGWSDDDAWNLWDYVCGVLSGGMLWLAENGQGYPCPYPSGSHLIPFASGFPDNHACEARWNSDLHVMASLLQRLVEDEWWEDAKGDEPAGLVWDGKVYGVETGEAVHRRVMAWLTEYGQHLWD